jgi:glutaredoxin
MNKAFKLSPLALLCCAMLAQAQMYKSVGPDGRVSYSDTPPSAAAARQVENRALPSAGAGPSTLPYALAQAAKAHPVTLYTSEQCPPCASARAFLAARGVPYAEKTVSSNVDIAALRAAGGEAQLPFLTVGQAREQGFEEGAWNNALSAAGYPKASQLPKTWSNPAPQPAAPRPADKPAVAPAAQAPAPDPGMAAPGEAPPAAGKAPPGFRF